MEKTRRLVKGQMAQILGSKAINIDKFSLTIGHHRVAKQTWAELVERDDQDSKEQVELLKSYSAGINEFVQKAILLPPEFIALGVSKIEPWHPIDSLAIMRLINFHLSANWNQELVRFIIQEQLDKVDPELIDLVDELVPYSDKDSFKIQTILNDEEWTDTVEKTLDERFSSKEAMVRLESTNAADEKPQHKEPPEQATSEPAEVPSEVPSIEAVQPPKEEPTIAKEFSVPVVDLDPVVSEETNEF